MKAPHPTQVGRYLVRDRIGQGGMGVLYLAVDPMIDRLVAIKLLRVHDDELHERFVREARSAGRVLHPNIVTIFDVGDHEGQPFIAMEYIAGETFSELIRRRAPLSWVRKVQLVADLCDGLGFAHRAGIVHRDIKPSNIMLSREGVLKILDFGIARVVDGNMTQTGAVIGTPNYMSPEQLDGRVVDQRSDIFAVGLVLYEFLTSKQAFPGDSLPAIAHKILAGEPEPLRRLDPSLNVEVVGIVERALRKDPSARYPNASAMRADLLKVIERAAARDVEATIVGEPPSAAPSSAPGLRTGDRAILAKRRASQIESHLQAARAALAEHRYEAAIEACEEAATLDPDEPRAHELLAQARAGMDERQVRALLDQARVEIRRGALTAALQLIAQTLALRPDAGEALTLQREVHTIRRQREQASQRQRQVESALEHARHSLEEGAIVAAVRYANEVLAHDPSHQEGAALKAQALALASARRDQEERERRSREAIDAARSRFASGDREAAIEALRRFDAPDASVLQVLAELRTEADAIATRAREDERRQREAAETRRRQEEQRQREAAEARTREEERRQREAAEARKREAEQHQREAVEARNREAEAQARDLERRTKEAEQQRLAAAQRKQEEERRLLEERRLREEEARRRNETGSAREAGLNRARIQPQAGATPGAARTVEPFEQDPGGEVAAKPWAGWRPRPIHLAIGGGALAVVVLAAVIRMLTSAPHPDPSRTNGSPGGAAPAPLSVSINATPWARVKVVPKDATLEVRNGTTPLVIDLPEGEYTLEFQNDLFRPLTQSLVVRSGQPLSVSVRMPGADIDRIVNDVLGPAQ